MTKLGLDHSPEEEFTLITVGASTRLMRTSQGVPWLLTWEARRRFILRWGFVNFLLKKWILYELVASNASFCNL